MGYARQKITRVSRTHRNSDANKQLKGRVTPTQRIASKRNTNVKSKRSATRVR